MIGRADEGLVQHVRRLERGDERRQDAPAASFRLERRRPVSRLPQITVHHAPDQSFANVGWTGWIGSITGMSSKRTAISEIGVSFPDASFGKESRFGTPFTFLLRDILQFDDSLQDAKARIAQANRTCDLILGVGDGKVNASQRPPFASVQYSHSVANFFDDKTMMPRNDSWHPRMDDLVYYGMDWLCPGFSAVLHRQLAKHYGRITPEATILDILPIVETGDLHIAIYDLTDNFMYVANAAGKGEAGPKLAYQRQFVKIDMSALFDQEAEPFRIEAMPPSLVHKTSKQGEYVYFPQTLRWVGDTKTLMLSSQSDADELHEGGWTGMLFQSSDGGSSWSRAGQPKSPYLVKSCAPIAAASTICSEYPLQQKSQNGTAALGMQTFDVREDSELEQTSRFEASVSFPPDMTIKAWELGPRDSWSLTAKSCRSGAADCCCSCTGRLQTRRRTACRH